jgi:hypothetical protein
MPKFLTISPTHIGGKKSFAWTQCRDGGYVSIGYMHVDLTGKSIEEVEAIIRAQDYPEHANAVRYFRKFLALAPGDYVAVPNTYRGLFGIGVVSSGYRYMDRRHNTGADDPEQFYSHFVGVEWKMTNYHARGVLLREGETGWVPYGTVGALVEPVPAYILRALGESAAIEPQVEIPQVQPEWLSGILDGISRLRKDPSHQERAHESLVEEFLVALGYRRHEDIKFRQGRIDLTLHIGGRPVLLFEVKRDWGLSFERADVLRQAYDYALTHGIRLVAVTNGDYYLFFDRLKGLSYESNVVAEFTLSALVGDDVASIDRIRPDRVGGSNVHEILSLLAECFPA